MKLCLIALSFTIGAVGCADPSFVVIADDLSTEGDADVAANEATGDRDAQDEVDPSRDSGVPARVDAQDATSDQRVDSRDDGGDAGAHTESGETPSADCGSTEAPLDSAPVDAPCRPSGPCEFNWQCCTGLCLVAGVCA